MKERKRYVEGSYTPTEIAKQVTHADRQRNENSKLEIENKKEIRK